MTHWLGRTSQRLARSVRKRLRRVRQMFDTRPKPDKCIIVASNGRSGSTLTFKAIRAAMGARDIRLERNAVFVSRLDGTPLTAPFVYKTHDFPDALASGPENVRVVFCFGSTKDSTISVYSAMERYGPEWVKKHFYNLHATGAFEDLFKRDVLQQARQIRDWVTFEKVPVLCVHYDAIWDNTAEISEFIGLDFIPPERRQREPKTIPEDIRVGADKIYDPIDQVVDELPKIFVASRQYAEIVDRLPIDENA